MRRWLLLVPVLTLLAPGTAQAAQREEFRVVVEGEGVASRSVRGEGTNGVCTIDSNTLSVQKYSYGRGKGLRVVFKRAGRQAPVLLARVGRKLAKFNVRGSYRTTAQGSASRSGPAGLCLPVTEVVGDESRCNRRLQGNVTLGLAYAKPELDLMLAEDFPPLPTARDCGANGVETMSGEPILGMFGLPRLGPAELPVKRIFGKKRAFKVKLRSGTERFVNESVIPGFPGRSVDHGNHRATIRFVRVD